MKTIFERAIRVKNWLKQGPVFQFSFAAVLGFAIAFFAPPRFLADALGVTILFGFIFAILAMPNEKKEPASILLSVALTIFSLPTNPTAEVKNLLALRCFFLAVTVLGAMVIGAFAAVPFQ